MPATPRELVERFYHQVWNGADEAEARKISQRGLSLPRLARAGAARAGRVDCLLASVHAALEHFTCTIEELIATEDRAAARMSFHGRHRGKMFGVEPTGRDIRWSGAAFFKVERDMIAELWVLGDIEAVRRQLTPEQAVETFAV